MGSILDGGVSLSKDDVEVVLQAIEERRVRDLDGVPYEAAIWNEEAVRDWLERTHQPTRARQIVDTLKGGRTVLSRPVAPTVEIALRALTARIAQLERELQTLRKMRTSGSTDSA